MVVAAAGSPGSRPEGSSMRLLLGSLLVLVAMAAAPALSLCVPTSADPGTYNRIDLPDGRTFYLEERGNPLGTQPPVPGSGFVLGDGTWLYEESNGLPGLQRGGIGLTGSCFPPQPAPCLVFDQDKINDETCGRGPDTLVW
jgi:hypothetical protein